ncbi:hypothetical protein BwSH20_25510 [Bradyrhizobium ottawaense]|nr:hypothetical protein BwSG10_56920 [Bradyrhizobium ottawaense]GMO99462.1 hypothetical protein BwSH20_25510 [Bradyrhizobium ottawaense]GMP08011.1 hypothetical protein BwDG23_56920 [Bradyrhizobium ottawaense]GMP17246.1 hypothetical protein BwSH12_32510 [Bradyrhizobium ottawaense]
MNIKLLGATAIAATMLAGSAMAQAVVTNPGRCSAQFPNANCQNLGPGNPYTDSGYRHRRASYRQTNGDWNNDWNRSRTGFWPTDVAAGVAGAAIGTAGAIQRAVPRLGQFLRLRQFVGQPRLGQSWLGHPHLRPA